MILGKKIKELRKESNYTQRALALKLCIGYSTLAMYETGQRDPDTAMLVRIATFFKVSTDYLLGLSELRTQQPTQIMTLSNDEIKLLRHYRNMHGHQKNIFLKVAEIISPEEQEHKLSSSN